NGVKTTADDPYANRTCPAVVGQNFAAGTEDGRALSMFTEGNLKANVLFQTIGGVIKEAPQWVKDCQNVNKVPLLAVGLMEPVPWVPNILPVQVVKIGQFAIAVTTFETTTMAGRRIRDTVKTALAGVGVTEVELASISNAYYAQYMTTKEEYLTQNYEGASTLFGPNQLAAVQQELVRVAASVADSSVALEVGPTPLQINRNTLITLQTGVAFDSSPLLYSFSYVRTQPSSSYAVGSVASAVFAGAHPKNALTLVSSFCDVQKLSSNGAYATVLTDAHWDLRYRWERFLIAESKNTCEWNIRKGGRTSVAGTYRFVHRGYSKNLLGSLTAVSMSWLDVAKDLNAGTIGGVAGIIAGHPLDTIKVQLQTSSGAGTGVLRTLRRVISSEGAAGLYRGLLSPILSNAPINAAIFGVQGQVVRALKTREDSPLTNTQHFIAGSAAGLVQVVFAAPSEHVKIQLQTGAMGTEHSSVKAARTILKRYGVKTLFKGWEICLLRDVPSFGAYFCCYEATKRVLTGGKSENETDLKLMMAGGIAGMVSWAACMPFDVVKSCVQGQCLEGNQMSMTEVARTRMKQEGPRFFFKGFGATMVRAFPVSAVTFLVYEKTIQLTS
ncbi:Hypothetical protein PHPALM_37375, partial [Phytophthora palmivora]